MRIRVSPTPSITPSHTPTITPSLTSCPTYGFKTNIKLFECNYGQTQVGLPLTGWTVEHSGITYTGLTQYTSPQDATWCNIPVQEPFVGASYIFNLTELPAGWELCANNNFGVAWDSFDVVLTGYTGRNCYSLTECVLDYTGVINYYLGGILQSSQNEVIQFIEYLVSENTSCSPSYTMFNQVMGFIVDIIRPTPTPTVTQTQTPSPTSCYQPKAYILFDSQTGATALNTWMASQGSAFRGMFLNAPSLVPATFEAQMNAYISYSGFGPSQYYALLPQNITPNQNPIIWNEGIYPPWEGTFVWVNMFVPTCPICPDGEYGLMGANGAAIHTTNDFRRSIPFYYSGTAIPQGFYRLYTTYAGTDMRLSSSGSEYILGDLVCPATPTPTPTNTQTRTPTSTPTGTLPVTPTQTSTPTTTPQVSPTQTQTSTPTRTPEVSPTNTQTSTPTNTQTSTPTGTPQATPTQTQTPSPTPSCDCLCFTTTYETIPEGLQVRWRDCDTGTVTTQDISSLLQRDNLDGTYTSFICVQQGLSYATPVCVLDGLEVTCDPLTWVENGPCCDSLDCDTPLELCITIPTNASLDVTITDVYVNGYAATPLGTWPNTPGNGASLTIALPAGTYTVQVFYSASVSGQKISILDSSSFNQCSPTSTGSSSLTFYGVSMDNIECMQILVEDGACV